MKQVKTFILLLLIVAVLVVSCDINTNPEGNDKIDYDQLAYIGLMSIHLAHKALDSEIGDENMTMDQSPIAGLNFRVELDEVDIGEIYSGGLQEKIDEVIWERFSNVNEKGQIIVSGIIDGTADSPINMIGELTIEVIADIQGADFPKGSYTIDWISDGWDPGDNTTIANADFEVKVEGKLTNINDD